MNTCDTQIFSSAGLDLHAASTARINQAELSPDVPFHRQLSLSPAASSARDVLAAIVSRIVSRTTCHASVHVDLQLPGTYVRTTCSGAPSCV